jgi:NADP-dependent 3-hydroxy acid dehydrogenase YdfG
MIARRSGTIVNVGSVAGESWIYGARVERERVE